MRTWFRNLTIGNKFLLSFGLIAIVLVLSLAAILVYLSRVNSYVDRHQRITIPGVVTAAAIQQTLSHMQVQVHHLLEHPSSAEQQDRLAQLTTMESQVTESIEVYRASHAARTHPILFGMLTEHGRVNLADQEDQAMADLARGLARLTEQRQGLFASLQSAQPDPRLLNQAEPRYEQTVGAMETAIGTLIEVHRKIDAEMKLEGDRLVNQARLIALGLLASLGTLIAFMYLTMRRAIAQPLRRLAATADRVAHHDLSAGFESWPSRDEVGTLAASLATMLTSLQERGTALMRKTKELEAFTYSIAHDLKGPLREIEGFSSILEKQFAESGDQIVRHHIDVIRKSSLRLTHMIDALLKYSRLEQQDLPRIRFHIREMIDGLVNERLHALPEPKPTVAVEVPFEDLNGEPVSIRQALTNLLDNALKFSRYAADPEIRITGRQTAGEQILSIQDNGIGFDPAQSDKLFGLFERLHGEKEYEGTGVGLAIVKMVMEKHGGRVWADSTPRQGSTFHLAFPLQASSCVR